MPIKSDVISLEQLISTIKFLKWLCGVLIARENKFCFLSKDGNGIFLRKLLEFIICFICNRKWLKHSWECRKRQQWYIIPIQWEFSLFSALIMLICWNYYRMYWPVIWALIGQEEHTAVTYHFLYYVSLYLSPQ